MLTQSLAHSFTHYPCVKHTGGSAAAESPALDILSADSWPGVPEEQVLLQPHEIRTTWREFMSASNVQVQQVCVLVSACEVCIDKRVCMSCKLQVQVCKRCDIWHAHMSSLCTHQSIDHCTMSHAGPVCATDDRLGQQQTPPPVGLCSHGVFRME